MEIKLMLPWNFIFKVAMEIYLFVAMEIFN